MLESPEVQKRRQTIRWILSVIVIVGFMLVLSALLFVAMPDGNRDLANIMIGFVGALATQVVSFYFGDAEGGSGKPGGQDAPPAG